MTDEELTRFALQLSQAERIRAQIAEDDAAADVDGGHELPPPAADWHPSPPAVVAA